MKKHPIQPVIKDENGRLRFQSNKIVEYILKHGGINLNDIAMLSFDKEDRQHFAQLIGYSLEGYNDLSYANEEIYLAAKDMANKNADEKEARIEYLTKKLDNLKKTLREPMADLFDIHPDDLN